MWRRKERGPRNNEGSRSGESICFFHLVILVGLNTGTRAWSAERVRVIIDADTANEIDDLYAIVRALVAPEFQVEGVTSTHFTRSTKSDDSVQKSQVFNERIHDADSVEQFAENPCKVKVFEAIDVDGLRLDFWQATDAALAKV